MADSEENIVIIDCETTKHLFFHCAITKTSALTLVSNLLGLQHELLKYKSGVYFAEEDGTQPAVEPKIVLHLNSPGGILSSAYMIADTISNMTIPVDCIVDETAASAAVIVLLSAKNRMMQEHSVLIFHETIHGVDNISYSDIMPDFVKDAKATYEEMVNYYVDKFGMKHRDVRKMLRDDTTLSKEEALEYGFITTKSVDV